MSSSIPFLPPVLETLRELLTTRTIPALDGDQMTALSEYLFRSADRDTRIRVAEVAYCNHQEPNALNLFLACTLPMAQKAAERRARRLFDDHPSDWQLECFYDGAVNALLSMFRRGCPLHPIPDSFRRYLYRTMHTGACWGYFKRDENPGVNTVENVDAFSAYNHGTTRTAEEVLITRDLLEQICQYPLLERVLSRTLGCILQLGPELAVTEPNDHIKRRMRTKFMLNVPEIAKVRGVRPVSVYQHLYLARAVIRRTFNGDGKLFMTR
jgi:hypothetical protein